MFGTAATLGSTGLLAKGVGGYLAKKAVPVVGGYLLSEYAKSGAQFAPGKFERDYRKSVKKKAEQLAKQQSGLSYGQEQRAIASGTGQIQAATDQRRAELARQMGGVQTGQSGMAAQQQRALSQQAMQGRQAVESKVRQMSVDEFRRQQAELERMRLQAIALRRPRKAKAIAAYQPGVAQVQAEAKGKADMDADASSAIIDATNETRK